MEKFIKKHKKISFFIISAAVFYFLIAAPLEKLNSNLKNLENKEKRFERAVYSEKIIKDNLEKLKNKKQELLKKYSENQEKEESYTSLGEFQNKIDTLLKKNNLKTLEIGRIVFEDEFQRVSYVTEGKEEDIINFLLETDNLKEVYVLKAPLEIVKNNENIKLSFGAEVKIKNVKENLEKEIKRKSFMSSKGDIKLVKFNFIGEKSGIFYIKTGEKIKRYYFRDGKKENFENELCEVEISKEKIVIKNLNSGKKIIFYLGDGSVEESKKD